LQLDKRFTMNLQDNNWLWLHKKMFKKLPKESFVLTLSSADAASNVLFVTSLSNRDFYNVTFPVLEKESIKYIVSEDAIIFKLKDKEMEIAYLSVDIYNERIFAENLFFHQNRSTSWSIGPWLIECFWSNVLSSSLLWGNRDLNMDKEIIENDCPKALLHFLDKELISKFKHLDKDGLSKLAKKIIIMDLRIALIRKIFISNGIFLTGLSKIRLKESSLKSKDKRLLGKIMDFDSVDFLKLISN